MTKTELLINLEYWAECLENPTYNSLEVGFRYTPLSKDEIIQRYKDECHMTRHAILRVIEMINEDGIELRECVSVTEWQPIETAPKDGTWFLAFYPQEDGEESFVDVTSWKEWPREMNADSWTINGVDPTHWMSLPEPPHSDHKREK